MGVRRISQIRSAGARNSLGNRGFVTGLNLGNVSILVTLNGIQGSATLAVTPPILTSLTITAPAPSLAKGTTVQLFATGNYTDGTTQDLTNQVSWISGDNTIAQISGALGTIGLVTGLSVGGTSIVATLNGIQGSTTVTVTPAVLTSITITPTNPSVAMGTKLQMTATGAFSDGTSQNLTSQVSWISSSASVAQIMSSSPKKNGGLMTKKPGVTTITATLGGVQGSTLVTVTP